MSVIYNITSDTYSSSSVEGLFLRTKPFIIHEEDDVIFGNKYRLIYKASNKVTVYHGGSGLQLTEIKNNEVFTARGKIFAVELEENSETEFNPFSLVEA